MKNELFCIQSDAVNRYGYSIYITAMEKSLKELYNKGIPMLIGHDFHRPIGWTLPFGIFIESKLSRMLANKMIAENSNDLAEIKNALQNFLGKRYYDRFQENKDQFLKLIEGYISGDYTVIDAGCAALVNDGITTRIFQQLFAACDDIGLIDFNELLKEFNYLGQGVFGHRYSGLAIYAHRYFRRSQSRHNNFHFHFLDALVSLKDKADLKIKIRLDKDMVGYSPSFHEVGELEFHYGPKYSDDISSIKSGISRHECDPSERFYSGISVAEFYWKTDDREMTFEMEELKDVPSAAEEDKYHCRYIHSIFNKDTNDFFHFDGAMRSYDMESMLDRVSKTFTQYGRKAEYKKMFRIDGKIELNTWKTLITHYLQGNPLIYEYFGVKELREMFKVIPGSQDLYDQLLPYGIKQEDGLKIFVSYHKLPADFATGRFIDIFDVMSTVDGPKIYCIEHLVFEVQKALQRVGEDLVIPEGIILTKCDDGFWNIPSIMHHADNTAQLLFKTVEAFINLFSAMVTKGVNFNVSLTLSFTLNDRIIRISSYGNIKNQIEWLRTNFPFEISEVGLTDWIEKQRKYLNSFEISSNDGLMGSLVQNDGTLYVKRIPVAFPHESIADDYGLKYQIHFPTDIDNGEFDLYNEGKIRPALHMSIEKAVWADTKENYFTSPRSKWLDDNQTGVEIIEATPLGLYWAST